MTAPKLDYAAGNRRHCALQHGKLYEREDTVHHYKRKHKNKISKKRKKGAICPEK